MEDNGETLSKRRRHAPVKHFHRVEEDEWASNAELKLIHEASAIMWALRVPQPQWRTAGRGLAGPSYICIMAHSNLVPPLRCTAQALRNSRREHQKTEVQHEEAPVFYPTVEEFADLTGYIKSIEPACEEYGIARVVPPEGFGPTSVNMSSKARFETKLQKLQALGEGTSFEDGRTFTVSSFRKQADKFKAARGYATGEAAYSAIEQDYWDALKGASGEDIQVPHAPPAAFLLKNPG